VSTNRLLQHVRSLIRRGGGGGVSDGQLLQRFVKERDETAFEVLVWRHGPMVLALGQRVLGNVHDAEDVLQATFLTLVRKAGSIGDGESLSSWLYKVAYRIALRSQARAAKMVADDRLVEETPAPEAADESVWRELRPLLDAAIQRLPEKYRTAIVLCDLQGKTHREAAEQLGCAVGTISTRVTRARELLRKRLAHRGLALSLGVLSAALSQRLASAMPATLTAAMVRAAARFVGEGNTSGIVSASVAELIEGANQAMLMTRFKIAALLVLALGGVAVGVGVTARREPPPPSAEPPRAEAAKGKADKTPKDAVTVRGRVLDPDGKPVKDARLYWPHLRTPQPRSEEDIEYPERAKTDAEGRFRFELPRGDVWGEGKMKLIATADGYGADWTELPTGDSPAELTLRLVKDLPMEGRIVSTEGKPLAGVRVGIVSLAATPQGKLDPFLTAWKNEWQLASQQTPKRLFVPSNKVLSSVTTDKDGRFRLGGGGVGRVALLEVRGTAISQGSLWVVGRDGFDPAEINKSVLSRTPIEERQLRQPPQLYGPKFTYVAQPSRRIEGRIREAGSGKSVAGYMILCGAGYNNSRSAVSDKEGRYQLDGLPKMKQYLLSAEPPANSSWLRAGARVEDREGLQPIQVDFTVARGVLVSGRILDRATGKGVAGGIRFVPLPANTFAGKPGYDSYKYERFLIHDVGADGRFRLAVMPGPGVLMVQAHGNEKANGGQSLNPYKQAEFDAKDRESVKITENDDGAHFTAIDNSIEFLNIESAVKVLDLAADAGTATCDLFVERGATQTVKIEDADGKPLTGTLVAGVTASWPITFTIPDATCTVFALDPKKPRRVFFLHVERKLAGSLTLRGDEKEPPVVRLVPTGSVTGRILEHDGRPLAGVYVDLSLPDRAARELYRQWNQRRSPIRTDKDGHFRIEGMVPDMKFGLSLRHDRSFLVGEPRIGLRQVKPGETLDLGEVRVKPRP
jgi:RNA polymerase sigma factor (sigma-70 family)